MSTEPKPAVATESTIWQLSWRSFLLALGITLAIFFGLHPLWKPLDMDAMDRNIGWSYAPIPLLVAVLLAVERKLRWSSFLLETVRLTLVKFVITFLVANTLWMFVGPPTRTMPPLVEPPAAEQKGLFDVREPPPATPIDAAKTGRLEGVVVDAAGAPVAGAFVAVADGLQDIVFAPRPESVTLRHDGTGLVPPRAVVQLYEKLVLRGDDAQLHTVQAIDVAGKLQFNVALVAGAERTLMFHRALGLVRLQCSVHPGEHAAELAIVGNPFATFTGDDGSFRFVAVPAAELTLSARGPTGRTAELRVPLAPGGDATDLRLTLP